MNSTLRGYFILSILLFMSGLLPAPVAHAQKYPGTDDGARAMLGEFIKPGADPKSLSLKLKPGKADYEALFEKPFAAKLQSMYEPPWNAGKIVITGKPGQTEIMLRKVASAEARNWSAKASETLPGGYKTIASDIKPGQTIYTFKFVEPGKTLGMAYDGLVYVNGQWKIFPKAYRAREKN